MRDLWLLKRELYKKEFLEHLFIDVSGRKQARFRKQSKAKSTIETLLMV